MAIGDVGQVAQEVVGDHISVVVGQHDPFERPSATIQLA